MLRRFRLRGVLEGTRQTLLNNVRLKDQQITKLAIDADYERIHVQTADVPRYITIGTVPKEHQQFLRSLQTGNFEVKTQVVGGGWMVLDKHNRDMGRYATEEDISEKHKQLIQNGTYTVTRMNHGIELTFTDPNPPLPDDDAS